MSEPVAIKPKRTLSESQLEKLKLARVKALAVKKKLKEEGDVERIKHLEGKIAKLKVKDKTPDEAPPEEAEPEPPVITEEKIETEDLEEPPIVRSKKSKPKKPLVIYEESGSSDSDDNSNVVYIKKKSKRKQVAPEPAPQPTLEPPPIRREVVYNKNPMYRHNMLHHYM
jgi:hypothetical protein